MTHAHADMQHVKALVAVSLYLLVSVNAAHANEAAERAAVRDEATQAYRTGDIDTLERLHARYSEFLTQRTSSGAFKMTLFFDGIANAKRDATEGELQADIARTRSWATERKDSPLAHVLHASALQSYGGYFRGGGYANTVPPQAWKIYEDYTNRAAQYLLANETTASKSSTWHSWMLNVAKSSTWPSEVVDRLFEAGWKTNPNDYRLYRNVVEYLLPKWHGDALALDKFIRYAVTKAPHEYGPELYARLYSAVGENQFERRLYTDSLVEWPVMREGLELWFKRFPTDWNLNIFAYNACIAGDKELARLLLDGIGTQPQWEIWQPRARATFDTCTRWAADPDAEPQGPKKAPEPEGRQSQGHTAPSAA